jgi:hypothetical protein
MNTPKEDEAKLRAAGLEFDYPGLWSITLPDGRHATISDGPGMNGGTYEVQIFDDHEGTACICGIVGNHTVDQALDIVFDRTALGFWQARNFRPFNTGGNCMALHHTLAHFEGYCLVTCADDPEMPESLSEPVAVGYYTEEGDGPTPIIYRDSNQALIAIIGDEFARILRSWATDEQFEKMKQDNAAETSPSICHSHDFCDANQAMIDAMNQFGLPCPTDKEPIHELINTIWDYAKATHLTAGSYWKDEFPDMEGLGILNMPWGFIDSSWHNDACPRFEKKLLSGNTIEVWIDYAERSKRDRPDAPRYAVLHRDGDDNADGETAELFASEDGEQMLAYLRGAGFAPK